MSELEVGSRVEVVKGSRAGESGSVLRLTPAKVKLRLDRTGDECTINKTSVVLASTQDNGVSATGADARSAACADAAEPHVDHRDDHGKGCVVAEKSAMDNDGSAAATEGDSVGWGLGSVAAAVVSSLGWLASTAVQLSAPSDAAKDTPAPSNPDPGVTTSDDGGTPEHAEETDAALAPPATPDALATPVRETPATATPSSRNRPSPAAPKQRPEADSARGGGDRGATAEPPAPAKTPTPRKQVSRQRAPSVEATPADGSPSETGGAAADAARAENEETPSARTSTRKGRGAQRALELDGADDGEAPTRRALAFDDAEASVGVAACRFWKDTPNEDHSPVQPKDYDPNSEDGTPVKWFPATTTVFSGPLFDKDGPKADDVHQGRLGDCYFAAALNLVAQFEPKALRECVRELPPESTGGVRTFEVTFQHHVRGRFRKTIAVRVNDVFYAKTLQADLGMFGELGRRKVKIADVDEWGLQDDKGNDTSVQTKLRVLADRRGAKYTAGSPTKMLKVLNDTPHPLYANTGDRTPTGCVWPMVLEKAWAIYLTQHVAVDLNGSATAPSYTAIDASEDNPGTRVELAAAAIARWTEEVVPTDGGLAPRVASRLWDHVQAGQPAALTTGRRRSHQMAACKLHTAHTYAVLGCHRTDAGEVFLLHNPHNRRKGGADPAPPVDDVPRRIAALDTRHLDDDHCATDDVLLSTDEMLGGNIFESCIFLNRRE